MLLFSLLVTFSLLSFQTLQLSDAQIVNVCHCDLTQECDCCCDKDCSDPMTEDCFRRKSSKYCPKTQFFKSIEQSQVQNQVCYYYNSSDTIISQKSMSNTQMSMLIEKNKKTEPVSTSITMYKGYQLSSDLTIGEEQPSQWVLTNGTCNTRQGKGKTIKFGHNSKITCLCSASACNPSLFSWVMGKKVNQFLGSTQKTVTTPNVTAKDITSLTLNFIIGQYGSKKVKYINRVTSSYSKTATEGENLRTLFINFINGDTLQEEETSASFFPQIPKDMFYPIHMMRSLI